MGSDESITSVQFRNFKALENFSISLERMNILVGPNNSGKSTVIGAFRVLAMGLRRAALRNPELLGIRDGTLGYRIPRALLPITLENAQTDYQDVEATVTFRLTNGNKLRLSFIRDDDDCIMYAETADGEIVTRSTFSRQFPISLLVVPVLGPVENREQIVKKETVDQNLATHRASRNFRNYWHHYPTDFQAFRQQVVDTWPGMDIQPPELAPDRRLSMFCLEDRITRELYWTGYGFQVWCQLLSHIFRSQNRSVLIIDEPDIYLHANPQRQLLSILKTAGPDVLIATHSSEIVAEADDILVIDKTQRSARRLRSLEGIQTTLISLGSIHTVTMAAIAQTRRVLYIEGEDFKILRRFARRLGLNELGAGVGIAPFPLGGFPSIRRVKAFSLGVSESIGGSILFGGIFDRDFRPDEEIDKLLKELNSELALPMILARKEIENYLLIPRALDKALARLLDERARRIGESVCAARPTSELLQEITEPMQAEIQAQYIAKRVNFLDHTGKDASTISQEAIEIFNRKWRDDQLRLDIVPGKRVLSQLVARVQNDYKVILTPARIIEALRESDMPSDLRQTLRTIDSFRRRAP